MFLKLTQLVVCQKNGLMQYISLPCYYNKVHLIYNIFATLTQNLKSLNLCITFDKLN